MGKRNRNPLSHHLSIAGLEKPTLKMLNGRTSREVLGVWDRQLNSMAVRVRLEEMLLAIFDHFALIDQTDELMGVLGERVPWTGRVPNDTILTLFHTLVDARRKYNAINGPVEKKTYPLPLIIQRFIDLSDGNTKSNPDPYYANNEGNRSGSPGKQQEQVLGREAVEQEAQEQMEEGLDGFEDGEKASKMDTD
ncbi:hypothetical protein UCREL1_10783 [Eutypa lata UCREL1]|uniref:Uncharacterized protein n=1 Tax=Eutypa lata (strain UCR-EL1) TaxID=1287681 RepID=M7SDN4_EUTLA|nr:hypothetical protein UCREL1_10783 [Eutypa lata UCREL1]